MLPIRRQSCSLVCSGVVGWIAGSVPIARGRGKARSAAAFGAVGVIMQDKGDTAKAKAVYQQVINKFPGTDGAKQAQKRLNALG